MIPKFSTIDKQKKNEKDEYQVKFKGDVMSVIEYKDWEFVSECDVVAILPYLRDESYILMRHEPIPTYQYFYRKVDEYKSITHFLTCISGKVEVGETLENTVRRELYEETGIVLSNLYKVDIQKSLFMGKGNVSRYHICLLELRYNDYRLTAIKGDGTLNEKNSSTIKISLGDLDEIRTHDLITDYLLTSFKTEYKLK